MKDPTMAELADGVRALIAADADYARVDAKVEEMELLGERLAAEQPRVELMGEMGPMEKPPDLKRIPRKPRPWWYR